MQKKQGTTWMPSESSSCNIIGVPSTFHRNFILNAQLNLPPLEKLLERLCPVDQESRQRQAKLTKNRLEEFSTVTRLYLEFLQREKFLKLKKLRESQSKLPIAHYRDEIISAVSKHQVTIIAGTFH